MQNNNKKYCIPREFSHWAYRTENDCHLAKIRRQVEETDAAGWRKIVSRPDSSSLPHKVMMFDEEVIYRGKCFKVLFLELWTYRGEELYEVKKLMAEMDEIPSEEPLSVDLIVRRLHDGLSPTSEELQQSKKWLMEYQAANDMTLRDLDTLCFNAPEWVRDHIFCRD